ncbi:MAG: sigma-54-dependent Fis family transcriptional regulator [Spirochaetia bacterium]|nr:sigma-54-dependent Fis family transcriptional regulator [Spirochaetia bacterium]
MRILVVDDEINIRNLICTYLELEDFQSDAAENGLSAQRFLTQEAYDAVLLDLKMPGMNGLELLKWIRHEGFRMPVIMISAHGEIPDAVAALKEGAQDYVTKPFDIEELTIRLRSLIETYQLRTTIETRVAGQEENQLLVGSSKAITHIRNVIDKISHSEVTVLITGESGTGKEVVARQIHMSGEHPNSPFVAVNIGGVPGNLLESELFGYEKGAFTGANSRKNGMFELASGGTLFLDEIGDMPMELQVKLLRVLQERKMTRLGGTQPIPINARIIAATNRVLEERVREGLFREDLFYRLNVVRIAIPPLRERREDIPLLSADIVKKLNKKMGLSIKGLSLEVLTSLKEHPFYGNVRELENILERAMIFSVTSTLQIEDVTLTGTALHGTQQTTGEQNFDNNNEIKNLKELEEEAIIRSLHRWEGNRTKAALELGISRRTLINKISEYHLDL